MSLYGGLTRWIGNQTWLRPVAPLVSPVDRVLLGKFGRRMTPFPTLLLTTIGRNSGKTVDTPLWYLEEGRELAVIASNFGRHEPDWSRNLRANPTCTVKIPTEPARPEAKHGIDTWRGLPSSIPPIATTSPWRVGRFPSGCWSRPARPRRPYHPPRRPPS